MHQVVSSPCGEELVFDHVTCRYGRRTVVHDACLHARAGEHVALIGANGSGKTTLLRAALGLHPVASGSILLGGREGRSRTGWADRRREIAWMPQRQATGSFPLLVGELLASSSAPEHAAQVARRLGLEGLLWRPLGTLSGGQLQRAFLARAIGAVHGGATALLADEPTAALDFDAKADVAEMLTGLAVTVVVVTHDPTVAEMCDRRLEMAAGRLRGPS
jgi:zinc transport system ATP-binding protein